MCVHIIYMTYIFTFFIRIHTRTLRRYVRSRPPSLKCYSPRAISHDKFGGGHVTFAIRIGELLFMNFTHQPAEDGSVASPLQDLGGNGTSTFEYYPLFKIAEVKPSKIIATPGAEIWIKLSPKPNLPSETNVSEVKLQDTAPVLRSNLVHSAVAVFQLMYTATCEIDLSPPVRAARCFLPSELQRVVGWINVEIAINHGIYSGFSSSGVGAWSTSGSYELDHLSNDGAGIFLFPPLYVSGVTPIRAFSVPLNVHPIHPQAGVFAFWAAPMSGSVEGGTQVTIQGFDFAGADQDYRCSFGGKIVVARFWGGTSHFNKVTCYAPPGHATVPVEFAFSFSAGREWFVGEDFVYTPESPEEALAPKTKLYLSENLSVQPVSFSPLGSSDVGGGLLVVTIEPSYKGKTGASAAAALSLVTANDVENLRVRCMFDKVATHAIVDAVHHAIRCIIPPKPSEPYIYNTVSLQLVAKAVTGSGMQRVTLPKRFLYGLSAARAPVITRPPPVPLDFGHQNGDEVVSVVGGTLVKVRGVNLQNHEVYHVRVGTGRSLGIYDFTQNMIVVRTPPLPGPGVYFMELSLTGKGNWVSVPGRLVAAPIVRLTMQEAPAEELGGPAVGVDLFYAPALFVAGETGTRSIDSITVTYRVNNNQHTHGPAERTGQLKRFPRDEFNEGPLGPFLWFLRLSFLKPPAPPTLDSPSEPSSVKLPPGVDVGDGNADDIQLNEDMMVLITSFKVKIPVCISFSWLHLSNQLLQLQLTFVETRSRFSV